MGGLPGEVSFGMVSDYMGPYARLFKDACVLTIVFTTLVQGILARPFVNSLSLQKNRERIPRIRDMKRFAVFQETVNGGEVYLLLLL